MRSSTKNPRRRTLYFILTFMVVLLSSTFVFGQPIYTWITPTSFPITITSTVQTTGGDIKMQNLPNNNFSGEIALNVDLSKEFGLVADSIGCYVFFQGDDGTKICIDDFVAASAETKSKARASDAMRLVGTGTIMIPIGGVPKSGIVYIDVKGTVKHDPCKETLLFNGKIGGGGPDFVLTSSFRSTFVLDLGCQ